MFLKIVSHFKRFRKFCFQITTVYSSSTCLYAMIELYVHLVHSTKFETLYDKFRSATSPDIVKICIMITQQKACRLQCFLPTKFETSYDKFRSETLPFMVKICIMIIQERACKLQRLLQIQFAMRFCVGIIG